MSVPDGWYLRVSVGGTGSVAPTLKLSMTLQHNDKQSNRTHQTFNKLQFRNQELVGTPGTPHRWCPFVWYRVSLLSYVVTDYAHAAGGGAILWRSAAQFSTLKQGGVLPNFLLSNKAECCPFFYHRNKAKCCSNIYFCFLVYAMKLIDKKKAKRVYDDAHPPKNCIQALRPRTSRWRKHPSP